MDETSDDVANLEMLLSNYQRQVDSLVEVWHDEKFERWLTDVDENGQKIWIFNSGVEAELNLDKTRLLEIKLPDTDEKIRLWHVRYDVSPSKSSEGSYLPFTEGESVTVLPPFGIGAPKGHLGLGHLTLDYENSFNDAHPTLPLSREELLR